MRQLKYRRRQDAGLTRVWVGRQRTRVMKALIRQRDPLPVMEIARLAGTSYALTNDLLGHLDAAGYVTCEQGLFSSHPDTWGRYYRLNDAGAVFLAVFLAPRG